MSTDPIVPAKLDDALEPRPVLPVSVQALAEADPVAFVQRIKQARELSVALTYGHDWIDMGGRPYLMASGVERLKPLWGIRLSDITMEPSLAETRRLLREGQHVTVEVWATVTCRQTGETGRFHGGRSSDDAFYADRDGGLAAVDPEDLRKAAFSNMEVNSIMRLLGLRNLTWEDLARYGLTRQGAQGAVSYQKAGPTEGQDRRTTLAEEIRVGLTTVHGPHAEEALWLLSKFQGDRGQEKGLRTWGDMSTASEKWLAKIAEKVRKEVTGWSRTAPSPTPSPSPRPDPLKETPPF